MNETFIIIIFIFSLFSIFSLIIFLVYKGKLKSSVDKNKLNEFQSNFQKFRSLLYLTKTLEDKISNINKNIGSSLNEQTEKTQKSLSEMRERLAIIDNAQMNINELTTQVHSLKNILSINS